jgi:hypothetical protein
MARVIEGQKTAPEVGLLVWRFEAFIQDKRPLRAGTL